MAPRPRSAMSSQPGPAHPSVGDPQLLHTWTGSWPGGRLTFWCSTSAKQPEHQPLLVLPAGRSTSSAIHSATSQWEFARLAALFYSF